MSAVFLLSSRLQLSSMPCLLVVIAEVWADPPLGTGGGGDDRNRAKLIAQGLEGIDTEKINILKIRLGIE